MSLSFADLGVPAPFVKRLADQGIHEPFAIQAAALPDALAGRDVIGRAPTGSGKTIAFGLALLARTQRAEPYQPRGLVLVPTRELAAQVQNELAMLTNDRGRRIITVYGGTSYKYARQALARGVDIIVACPGRLEDLLAQDDLDLSSVKTVVVDEADRMADMGFAPAVRRIIQQTNANRHVMLFSATLGHEVRSLIEEFTHKPIVHDVVGDAQPSDVDHHFWLTPKEERLNTVVSLLEEYERAIIFCKTKHGADRLAFQLQQRNIRAVAIHGDRSQSQREKALAAVVKGQTDVLVATDVAARGIHIDALPCVIHYDLPQANEDYVHRSGRTGRAGETGVVVSIIANEFVGKAKRMQRELGLEPKIAKRADAEPQRLKPTNEKMRPLEGKAVRSEEPLTLADVRALIDAEEKSAPREPRGPRTNDRPERGKFASEHDRRERPRRFDRDDRPARDARPRFEGDARRGDRDGRSPERRERFDGADRRPRVDGAERRERFDRRDAAAPTDRRERFDGRDRREAPARAEGRPRFERRDRVESTDRRDRGDVPRRGGDRPSSATVSFFNDQKGYGFAVGSDGQELFIHFSQIADRGVKTLFKGQKVQVEVARGPKGLEARNVRLLDRRPPRS